MRQPHQVAVNANQRGGAIGQRDGLDLDEAQPTAKKLCHQSSFRFADCNDESARAREQANQSSIPRGAAACIAVASI
jgi:hypothetical protein